MSRGIAAIRADLDDMEFEFVQGTVLHTEGARKTNCNANSTDKNRKAADCLCLGNWSLYTTAASDLPLYGYYNPLSAQSVLETEESLLELIKEEGPFDGVLGYSAGASLAGQIICSDFEKHPFKSPDERPFRFACFINAISPLKAFRLDDEQVQDGVIEVDSVTNPVVKAALDEYLRPSATRARKSFHKRADMPDSDAIRQEVESLQTRLLEDGTPFFTDGVYGMTRYDANFHGTLITIPTLHVRCPESGDAHDNGAHTQALCEPDLAKEIHHPFGHDFPRGAQLLKKISTAFRELADSA